MYRHPKVTGHLYIVSLCRYFSSITKVQTCMHIKSLYSAYVLTVCKHMASYSLLFIHRYDEINFVPQPSEISCITTS